MTKGFNFTFEYEHLSEEGEDVMLTVEAHMSEYYPAVMHLSNGDPGYPAEGGEVEYHEVRDPYGEAWDLDIPTLTTRWRFDKDERGRVVPESGRREWVTVPLREALEDAAVAAAADQLPLTKGDYV